jgi:hypothetical protein
VRFGIGNQTKNSPLKDVNDGPPDQSGVRLLGQQPAQPFFPFFREQRFAPTQMSPGLQRAVLPEPLAHPATRPGDTLRVDSEILEILPSHSKPNQGFVTVRSITVNQNGDPVQVLTSRILAFKRKDSPTSPI